MLGSAGDNDLDFGCAIGAGHRRNSGAGFEYYADLGQIGSFGTFSDQQHTLFAVTDFRVGAFDVNFGVGYGLTPASDRLVFKTINGYAFPIPAADSKASEHVVSGPINPMAHPSARTFQP
jgi:hypothetical protein